MAATSSIDHRRPRAVRQVSFWPRAFWGLNLWGEERFEPLRRALLNHAWRLPKKVIYLFDGVAHMLHHLLHPRPKVQLPSG